MTANAPALTPREALKAHLKITSEVSDETLQLAGDATLKLATDAAQSAHRRATAALTAAADAATEVVTLSRLLAAVFEPVPPAAELTPEGALAELGYKVTRTAVRPARGAGSKSYRRGQVELLVRIEPPLPIRQPNAPITELASFKVEAPPDQVEELYRRDLDHVVRAHLARAEADHAELDMRLQVTEARVERVRAVVARVRRLPTPETPR